MVGEYGPRCVKTFFTEYRFNVKVTWVGRKIRVELSMVGVFCAYYFITKYSERILGLYSRAILMHILCLVFFFSSKFSLIG